MTTKKPLMPLEKWETPKDIDKIVKMWTTPKNIGDIVKRYHNVSKKVLRERGYYGWIK